MLLTPGCHHTAHLDWWLWQQLIPNFYPHYQVNLKNTFIFFLSSCWDNQIKYCKNFLKILDRNITIIQNLLRSQNMLHSSPRTVISGWRSTMILSASIKQLTVHSSVTKISNLLIWKKKKKKKTFLQVLKISSFIKERLGISPLNVSETYKRCLFCIKTPSVSASSSTNRAKVHSTISNTSHNSLEGRKRSRQ